MSTRSRSGPIVAALAVAASVVAWASPSFADGIGHGRYPAQAGLPVVQVAQSPEGPVLVTGPGATVGAGWALYEFSGDAFTAPEPATPVLQFQCTASNTTTRFSTGTGGVGCTTPWPPLMTTGNLVAGPGVQQSGLSTVGAGSGYTQGQIEYFGHPLYTFVKDSPGTFNGENFAVFGGVFWLVSPRGGVPDAGTATLGTELTASGPALDAAAGNGLRSLYMLSYDTPGTSPTEEPPPMHPMHPMHPMLAPGTSSDSGPAQSTCSGSCSAVWPPLLTTGRPITGPGVDPRLVGLMRRPDGTLQVTYAGWPVYMYFADQAPGAAPGETNGQDLLDNIALGVWYEVAPQGGPQAGAATLTAETADGTLLGAESSATPPQNPQATVYTLSSDTSASSTCTGTCAKYWPPVLTSLPPRGIGLTGAIGTIQRPDGTFQVTYNGKPLYFFSQSLTSGDARGPSISTPFGTFSVVTP